MVRVKKGINALKHRRNVLKRVKGYRFGRSTKERAAQEAIVHAGAHQFDHRKDKKGNFRKLWTIRLNGILRSTYNTTYSKFINALKKADIALDRKVLADLAKNNPDTFKRVVEKVG